MAADKQRPRYKELASAAQARLADVELELHQAQADVEFLATIAAAVCNTIAGMLAKEIPPSPREQAKKAETERIVAKAQEEIRRIAPWL